MVITMGTIGGSVKEIKASEFKAKCLKLMDQVAETGEPMIITKNGHPVCLLEPFRPRPRTLYGSVKGSIAITGDIIGPIDVSWEADQ